MFQCNFVWLIYTDSKFKDPDNISPYPNIQNHLDKFIDSFEVISEMMWKQYEPDEIRVLIAFDN